MEPITTAIVTAVASGLSETGKKIIVDSYDALKTAIKRKFGEKSEVAEAVEKLEKNPEAQGRQLTLQDELTAVKAGEDDELKQLAEALLQALKNTPEGQVAISKYQVKAEKIGIVGDNAHVEKMNL